MHGIASGVLRPLTFSCLAGRSLPAQLSSQSAALTTFNLGLFEAYQVV
jgi:hypothetical protein